MPLPPPPIENAQTRWTGRKYKNFVLDSADFCAPRAGLSSAKLIPAEPQVQRVFCDFFPNLCRLVEFVSHRFVLPIEFDRVLYMLAIY